jgi:hypothetical protein
MFKFKFTEKLIHPVIFMILLPVISSAAGKADSTEIFIFQKKEVNTGITYSSNKEREEVRSAASYDFEELTTGAAQFRWSNRNWNILRSKQEEWNYQLEAGPFWGNGNIADSTSVYNYVADHKVAGVRGILSGGYLNRYYYDNKNYTIVSVDGVAKFNYYRQDSEGLLTDSNQVTLDHSSRTDETKFRAGFQAKGGWGIGRLNYINHYVAAAGLLEKYYPERIFSESEIMMLSREIGRIKHGREIRAGHDREKEIISLKEFLNWKMLLEVPSDILNYWELTEFRPRLKGSRIEFGPFFNYYNREPDFVYGGYVQFENVKYCNNEWNRNFSVNMSYNGYKHHDWLLMEVAAGWSYYPDLKSELTFGLKYVPGMVVNSFENPEPVRHSFIPYIEYFSQINSRYRMEAELALRIAPVEQFIVPGPRFSVSIYKSRY